MMKFIPIAIIMVFFFGICYIIFMPVANLLYSDTGLQQDLDEQAQKQMTGDYLDRWDNYVDKDETLFGITLIALFGVFILILIIFAFNRQRRSRYE